MGRGRVIRGQEGENLACRELQRRGYAIVARRHRSRMGELDIVALDGPTLVFVEVKMRCGREYGSASDAITPWKQHRIVRLAQEYVASHGLIDRPCRFDVVSIQVESGRTEIEVIQHAFHA